MVYQNCEDCITRPSPALTTVRILTVYLVLFFLLYCWRGARALKPITNYQLALSRKGFAVRNQTKTNQGTPLENFRGRASEEKTPRYKPFLLDLVVVQTFPSTNLSFYKPFLLDLVVVQTFPSRSSSGMLCTDQPQFSLNTTYHDLTIFQRSRI